MQEGKLNDVFCLNGKTALVTGAATGVGRAIAMLFHAAGANVFGADINETALASLAGECPGVRTIRFDQADPDSIAAMFDSFDKAGPALDVLVNCAAVYPFCAFEDIGAEFFDKVIAINLRGPVLCMQHAVKRMKRDDRGGSIVNISSISSIRDSLFDFIHYGASKAGVNSATVAVALEYAPHNIRVNCVMPGGVMTDQAMQSAIDYGKPPRGPAMQPGRIPLRGTPCEPIEVARTCLFFASDASSYITGQTLAVDGGYLIS